MQNTTHIKLASRKRKKLVIVSKTRFVTASLLTLILLRMIIASITGSVLTSASATEKFDQFKVGYGDTLWAIAAQYLEEGDDIRQTVYNIQKENNIVGSNIYPGQILKIQIPSK